MFKRLRPAHITNIRRSGHLPPVSSAAAGPILDRFDLDLTDATLMLTFDTDMSNATEDMDWTGVSLRTHANGLEGSGVTLWNTEGGAGWGNALLSDSGFRLTVAIHPSDFDEMRAAYVGHNSTFTWLTLRRGAFVAFDREEPCEPVYGTQVVGHRGLSVGELVQDTIRSGYPEYHVVKYVVVAVAVLVLVQFLFPGHTALRNETNVIIVSMCDVKHTRV